MLANVGDSPAWVVTAAGAEQVSVEHTVAAELSRAGALSPEALATHPQRHVVTRAMGIEPQVLADARSVELEAGHWLVMASDGGVLRYAGRRRRRGGRPASTAAEAADPRRPCPRRVPPTTRGLVLRPARVGDAGRG